MLPERCCRGNPMQFEIPFEETTFSKDLILECINEWKEYLPEAKYTKGKTEHLVETGDCDLITCNEFINYVIDKQSMKELG